MKTPKYKKGQRLKSIHSHIKTHYWVDGFNSSIGDYTLRINPHHWFTVVSSQDVVENHMIPDDSSAPDRY